MRLHTILVALLAATTLSTPVLAQDRGGFRGRGAQQVNDSPAEGPRGGGNWGRNAGEARAPRADPRPETPAAPPAEVRAPRVMSDGGWRNRQSGDGTVTAPPVFRGGRSADGAPRDRNANGNADGNPTGNGFGNWRGGARGNGGGFATTPSAPPVTVADPQQVTRGVDGGRGGGWRGNGGNDGRGSNGNWRGGTTVTPPVIRNDGGGPRIDRRIDQRADRRDGWNGNVGNRGNQTWRGNQNWNGDRGRNGNQSWNGNDGRRGQDFRRDDFRRNDARNNGFRNDGFRNDGFRGGNSQRWDRNWRNDNRYNWQQNRQFNRNTYRLPRYYAPYGYNYGYRRFSIGVTLGSAFFGQNYWIDDVYDYRLPEVYAPYRWVRYYNDVLLVDTDTGEVVDVIYDFFW